MLGYYKMSIIGTAHQAKKDGVCQDASDVVLLKNGWVVASIADGLGSAKKSEVGSTTAVKAVLSFVSENHPDKWHEESLMSLLRTAYHKALKTIRTLSEENQDELCDYDTTLTTVIYNGTNVVYGHAGDGGIIALSSYGDYSVLTEAQKGEAFNETSPLRAGPDSWFFGVAKEDVCSLIMMTDGIFDVAYPWLLAKTNQPIYVNYVRPFMDINILKVSTPADFENAQTEITEFFKGPYSKQITDDKTIVGIINTDVTPETKSDEFYAEPDWEMLAKEHHDRLYDRKSSVDDGAGLEQDVKVQNEEEQKADHKIEPVDTISSEDRKSSGPTRKSNSSTASMNKKEVATDKETHEKKGIWGKLFGKS